MKLIKHTRSLVLVLVLVLVISIFSLKTNAASVGLYMNPTSTNPSFGSEVSFQIKANVSDFNAAQIDINYPSSALEYKGYSLTDSATPNSTALSTTPGSFKLSTWVDPPGPANGDVLLATINFKVIATNGTGNVSFAPTANLYNDGISLNAPKNNATVNFTASKITISWAVNSSVAPRIGQPTTLAYSVQNKGSVPTDTGALWICGNINGKPFGGGSNRKVLAPNETLTMSMSYTPTETGTLTVSACGDRPGGPGWTANYPSAAWADHRVRSYGVAK